MVLMLAVFSFLTFLWTAPHENSFWRLIIASGWAGGAVTLSSLLLRAVVDLQAGVAVAMISAILLESDRSLSLVDTVQVSKLRAGRAMPLDVILPSLRAIRLESKSNAFGYLRLFVVLLLLATTAFLQFTSTMLVSDLSLGILPGMPATNNMVFDFAYNWNEAEKDWKYPDQERAVSAWLRNPPAFPAFAEFSEGIDVPENVDDTGTVLRAFLPFQDAQSRETITRYSGKALVLDARVSCQRPYFQNLSMDSEGKLNGRFFTTENVSRLLGPIDRAPFSCQSYASAHGYSLSICQVSGVNYGGGKLLSDLRDMKQWLAIEESWSNARLKVQDSAISAHLVIKATLADDKPLDDLEIPPTFSAHGAWTNISYMSLQGWNTTYANLSISLCYPAFWTARLDVALHSPEIRTEPRAVLFDKRYRTDPDFHVQMGVVSGERNEMLVK